MSPNRSRGYTARTRRPLSTVTTRTYSGDSPRQSAIAITSRRFNPSRVINSPYTLLDYYDSTQFIFHKQSFDSESDEDIIFLNYCCSFYQIDVKKLSNFEDDSFLKCSHEILPKPNEIFDRVMDFDDGNILNRDVLDALFEETSVRLINFKASRDEIICLTDQDHSRAVYVYSLELKVVVQKINYRNPERRSTSFNLSFASLKVLSVENSGDIG